MALEMEDSSMMLPLLVQWFLWTSSLVSISSEHLDICGPPTGVNFNCPLISALFVHKSILWGFPARTSGEEPAFQCRRHKRCVFDPWVGKISWHRKWQPIPVFLTGESHGQRHLVGYSPWVTMSWTLIKQLGMHTGNFMGRNIKSIEFFVCVKLHSRC